MSRGHQEVSIAMSTAPASTNEALEMLTSALGYLAAADPTQMPASEQAECLQALERSDAVETAARARVLGAFTVGKGYAEDADYSPRAWLIHKTRITRGAATGHTAWAARARVHPRILAAMATGEVTEPYARTLCQWTDKIPEDCRDAADAILAAAAVKGMDLRDLAALAAEIQSRACPAPDPDPGKSFEDRAVRLETTFGGAGVLSGDLSPECTALVGTVLDALSAPRGAEDSRSHAQRYHDALHEAMHRLVAAGLLPDRAGQPSKALAHISLADLMVLDGDSVLQEQWIERVRAEWAGRRAAASVGGSDGAAWLEGEEAEGFACDASITPVVFGEVNPAVLDDLVRLCVQLGSYHGRPAPAADPVPGGAPADSGPVPSAAAGPKASPVPPGLLSREALEREIIRRAVALVSGPSGLAGFLRREQLGARLAGPSLPLDVGYADSVPASIRNAVKARDRFCQWAGGCHQPASACEVHHLKHKGRGGETSLENCILICWFHHHVMIHRMGWTLVRHPDGTTMAWNRDKSKVLRSHSPPARAG
ncbi:MAG: DUF222 domain-containing protein [Streptosporangiaceae bacterium]|jgi:hypothetical protein